MLYYHLISVSRILTVSLIASLWPLYTIAACICHWIVMTAWIIAESRGVLQFCRKNNHAPHVTPMITERIYSILFAIVIGLVHIFIYLNVVDGNTLLKHVFFYGLCFCENLIANLLWMFNFSTEVTNSWYFCVYIIPCTVPFLLGIAAMISYYIFFHPARHYQAESNLGHENCLDHTP